MKSLARRLVQQPVESIIVELAPFALIKIRQYLRLGRRQHTIEAPQHRHRQHDAFILWRSVGTAEQIGDLPDEIGEVVVIGHGAVEFALLNENLVLSVNSKPYTTATNKETAA